MELSGFACSACRTLFAIDDDLSETAYVELLLRSGLNCPLCMKGSVQATLEPEGLKNVITLKPRALWVYLNGLGLPKDVADWRTVQELLLKHKVTEVGFDHEAPIGLGRCIIEHLQLDNGKVLRFASSGAGAMVYTITEEKEDGRQDSEL